MLPAVQCSLFQSCKKAEVNRALSQSLTRRRTRLEKDSCSKRGTLATRSAEAQADLPLDTVAVKTRSLSEAVARALRVSIKCSKQTVKAYGPTEKQEVLQDPPEKADDLLPEAVTLNATLTTVQTTLVARRRQLQALNDQHGHCKILLAELSAEVDRENASLRRLKSDPSSLLEVQKERMSRRRAQVQERRAKLQDQLDKASSSKALARQQRAYLVQSERVSVSGGRQTIERHPAGEVALVLTPASMKDTVVDAFDIGTAVANPYVCDSWPFEPNVLARKSAQEPSMQPFTEETAEELMEEDRPRNPFRNNFANVLRLPARRGDFDEDEDDHFGEPTATSRSA